MGEHIDFGRSAEKVAIRFAFNGTEHQVKIGKKSMNETPQLCIWFDNFLICSTWFNFCLRDTNLRHNVFLPKYIKLLGLDLNNLEQSAKLEWQHDKNKP